MHRDRNPVGGGRAAEDPRWALSAEESGFEETASYDEVVSFLEQAAQVHPALHLVRDLALDRRPELLAELVLLIGPIYNADGNEALDL